MIRFFLLLTFILFPFQAFALTGGWKKDDIVAVRLISGVEAVGDLDVVPLGLEIKMASAWHTYWRSPGQSGLPPVLEWDDDHETNFLSAKLFYPAPRRHVSYGLETIGYRERVVFPIDVKVRQKGRQLRAALSLNFLVCGSVCLPEHFDLEIVVPAGPAQTSAQAQRLAQAREELPRPPEDAGIVLKKMRTDGESLELTFFIPAKLDRPDIFVENDKNIGFGAPEISRPAGNASAVAMTVRPIDTLPAKDALADLPLTLTVVNGDVAIQIEARTPAQLEPFAQTQPQPKTYWGAILLLALLGGFILNLMPCVLPVLSLKLLSVVSHGGGERFRVRQSFLVTACGIVFSFLVLAGVTIALKRFGVAFGWGVQFQQPAFLMFLVLLLTFFAANMWGLFDVPLPRFLADRLGKPYRPKLVGDFATGAFATLLATPCSAPFLGTAVGFALAAGPGEILAVFAALGVGLALPYLTVAIFPSLATKLPKPGLWMVRLRHLMGFALALTALWLLQVMATEITLSASLVFAQLMAALVLLMALRQRGAPRRLTTIGMIVVCLSAVAMGVDGSKAPKPEVRIDRQWAPYKPASLRASVAEGKTVFLDVTADWCLTCKANKLFALSDERVSYRLFQTDVVAMQSNWTNPDPEIAELLCTHGRFGIPFNIVYGPHAPQGLLLPEILTPRIVLDALDKASGTKR